MLVEYKKFTNLCKQPNECPLRVLRISNIQKLISKNHKPI